MTTKAIDGLRSCPPNPGTLIDELAALRAELNTLAVRLGDHYGAESHAALRAEQASAAVQRLEWALAKPQATRKSAYAAAG